MKVKLPQEIDQEGRELLDALLNDIGTPLLNNLWRVEEFEEELDGWLDPLSLEVLPTSRGIEIDDEYVIPARPLISARISYEQIKASVIRAWFPAVDPGLRALSIFIAGGQRVRITVVYDAGAASFQMGRLGIFLAQVIADLDPQYKVHLDLQYVQAPTPFVVKGELIYARYEGGREFVAEVASRARPIKILREPEKYPGIFSLYKALVGRVHNSIQELYIEPQGEEDGTLLAFSPKRIPAVAIKLLTCAAEEFQASLPLSGRLIVKTTSRRRDSERPLYSLISEE